MMLQRKPCTIQEEEDGCFTTVAVTGIDILLSASCSSSCSYKYILLARVVWFVEIIAFHKLTG